MMTSMATPSEDMAAVRRVAAGDREHWGELLRRYHDRLRNTVVLRLDRRLLGRVDASDIMQEASMDAFSRLSEYARKADPMPFFLWLRFLTLQRLQIVHRHYLGAKARDAARDVSIQCVDGPGASSLALAEQLLGRDTRASHLAIRAERALRLQEALDSMDPTDREVLTLRNFEQLSNAECARGLGLSESAATKRYIRALKRLKEILAALPGGISEFRP